MIPYLERLNMVGKDDTLLSLRSRCMLLSVSRSSISYARKIKQESPLNIEIMHHIDTMYLEHPEFGPGRMHTWLTKDKGFQINLKRVERLYYNVMGLMSLLPGPHTSRRCPEHKKYPYLLRGVLVLKVNMVWMTDITYIPMSKGFMYMMAFIDVYSRKILHWSISNVMDSKWCCDILEECIEIHGCPEILNTDQGSQFTSDDFIYRVVNNRIKLSMDGKGRAVDNIYIERFWRTLKYEHIYIRPANNVDSLLVGLEWFIYWYNTERYHTELDNQTPDYVYSLSLHSKVA